ncbi:beta-fructofuranosidase, soluble isoenzyme I [Selaginella moellendorffii]|uniref:beta-fructofuranosidase, soluble isoenzyme I n=1 Tax=Selaginella moellendorffii TaxID=88036 RepID=UPI000D1C8913|nr:beta-fructofuranosidase, soluble isoenzyme I [Selaginella moellendorffii]|eukprot:XP_024517828.1 beta-fructofuranosidase, soluble isoenzyme I [Selaginella moellendorffii]
MCMFFFLFPVPKDPNGPMLYKGLYHLFFQYNPTAPVFGNISWGHAVSKDLINWSFLDLALQRDKPYDQNGAFSGSITFVKGVPVILYTGSALNLDQSQNEAVPANISDPLVRTWKKLERNPIIFPPPSGVRTVDFRDPTTAWIGADGLWRILVGAKKNATGAAILYTSKDFVHWDLVDNPLHEVAGTGMWECPDFYPVSSFGTKGLEDSVRGSGVKHVLKVSLDNTRQDAYAVGTYDAAADKFIPNVPELDTGIGLVYDYGVFYASKTFYDPEKQRRVLWGWVTEKDSVEADIAKGWAGVQALPRQIWLDETHQNGVRQWPLAEVYKLRRRDYHSQAYRKLQGGALQEIHSGRKKFQLDIEVTFTVRNHKLVTLDSIMEDGQTSCLGRTTASREAIGPFGLMVLASDYLQEHTAIYFALLRSKSGWKPLACSDIRRSSLQPNVTKTAYGGFVNVTSTEQQLTMRVIVDHSIIETFFQGGRTCITSRVYPTSGSPRLFLFNNGSAPIGASIALWGMKNATFTLS